MEMCRITLVVLCTKYTHGFILITLLFPEKCPWNSVEMFSMTLVVRWTNSTHWFTLITFFTSRKISLSAALDQFYPWVHFNNSFTSRKKMSLGLSEDVQTDFRVATDQIYPWVHYNNSFSSRKMSLELSGDV